MSSTDFVNKLLSEYKEIENGKNPAVTADIDAVVVLSGESAGVVPSIYKNDTEERTETGIEIYKQIEKLGGKCHLLIDGTDVQNKKMSAMAKAAGVGNILPVLNPPYPAASTETQFRGLLNLNFKKLAIVTHAYHGVRAKLAAAKYLPGDVSFELFLIGRGEMIKEQKENEIKKIQKYFNKLPRTKGPWNSLFELKSMFSRRK